MNKKITKGMHYFMLFIMLHITFIVPAHEVAVVYKETFNRLKLHPYLSLILPNGEKSTVSPIVTTPIIQNGVSRKELFIKNNKEVLSTINVSNEVSIINADLKEGIIGVSKTIPMDNPSDNLFKFTINEMPSIGDKVVLKYELFGVEDQNSVARSINDRYSIGGHIIKTSNQWSTQTEELNTDWLNKGENKILFTTEKESNYQYKIKNIRLEITKGSSQSLTPLLVVQSSDITLSKDNKIYLKGFLRNSQNSEVTINVEGTTLKQQSSEFEGFIDLNSDIQKKGFVVVRAYDSKGLLGQQLISLAVKLQEADAIYLIGSKKTFDKVAVKAFEKSKVAIDGASLEIVDSSLVENKLISISELRHVDFAPLSSDLTNVTKSSVAYRFLPDGTLFAKPVPVTISYDPKLLPFGYTAKDIKTFYFDTKNKTWQTIPVVSFDEKNHTITSLTTHFTDYINGIIKVPESPETNAYTPTSLSGIKIANPGEKINLIQAPAANQQGDANLSYPIEIPSGRGGMQPNLSVSYNSANSNGWMGLGWNISSPSIELDTRWGSPNFDSSTESEIYTLGGEQLLLKSSNGFYLANKSNSIGRITNAMFYERVEGSFNKIQRVGSSPSTYSWTVTDKSGTISTYGSTTDAVLTNNTGNIARWMLKKVQDINGNSMEYFYTTKTFTDGTTSGGKQIYLQRIEYTKHTSLAAPYSVVFNRTTAVPKFDLTSFTREDKSINARLGFKEITDDVLESIEVKYGAALVRKYKFIYKQGVFKKTLLDRIQQWDGANVPVKFNEHTMEYYDDTNNGQNIFGNEISVSGLSKDGGDLQGLFSTTLGASHTSSYSAGIGATVGYMNSLLFFETLIPISQSGTGGVTGGISGTDTTGKITLIDVNGDGLPDKLFNSSSLGYRKNLGNNSFSSAISIPSMNEFTRSNSFSKSLGVKGNFSSGVFAGAERTWTNSYTNSYLEDVNGDGLIDVVKDRKVYFNSLNSSATPTFTTLSSNTPNVIYQGLTSPPVANTLPTPILNNPVFDVVKVWRAPYTGTVAISGTVTLPTIPVAPADGVYFSIETGNFLNEFPLPSQTSTVSTTPINILTAQGYPITLNVITPTKTINSTLSVTKGQRIYFRANTISNDKNDLVNFNTNQININYTNTISTVATMPNANQLDAEQISYVNNSATDGFVVSAEQKINLAKNGSYTVSYPSFTITNPIATGTSIPELSDEVQLLVEKHTRTIVTNPSDNSVISDNDIVTLLNTTPTRIKVNTVNTIPAFSILDVVTSIDVDNTDNSTTQAYYMFKIDAKSNVDWKKLNDNWKPKIVMPIPDNSVPGSTTTDVYPIPYLSIYNEKTRTTDTSIVTPTTIEKYANYIIPPAMNLTGTTRKLYQMQPIFPSVSGVNKFNQCTTCTSNLQIRKLYLTVKGTNKNLLFNNTTATTATMPTAANQLINLAKYEISVDYNGNIISTATGATNSGIKRFNTSNGLYDINITGTTSSTVPQSTLINVIFDAIDNGSTTPLLIKNNRIYFEYFTDDIDIANSLANVPFGSARIRTVVSPTAPTWTYANNLATAAIYPNIFYKKGISYFGSNYRNWGQFAYRTEKIGTSTLAIRESELIPNAPLTTTQQTAAQNAISACGSASPPLSDSAYQTCVEEALYPPATNPLRRMLSLIPDASFSGSTYYKRWKGSQTNMFVADKEMSPKNKYDETVPTLNLPVPTITASSEAFGIVKETKSTSNSVTVGAGVGAFTNFGDNKVLNDHKDINGDNYPDFIDEGSFQLTNKLGNLYPIITSQGYRQDSKGNGWGSTVAGSIPRFNYVPKGSNGTTTNQTTNTGSGKDIGFNGSLTFSSDESKNILLDINGDGLTDRVDVDGVNLNIGGSSSLFEGITNWNYGAVQKGNTSSIATGAGLSLFSNSVTLGLGIGTSTSPPLNNNSETFLDINGDGLVDKIEGSTVRYNLGTTFDNTPTSINNFDKSHQSVSANASLNAGFTACFYFPIPVPLIPPFLFYLTGPKFCACGNGSLGYGINSENLQMVDVNGDGFLDIASSSSENELKVRYSNIGRTNMLKTVNRPLGSSITMDYAVNNPIDGSKIGNTYKMPFAKWAMTSVVVYDGHTGDGQDYSTTKFTYLNGFQDRRERSFLGFGVVKTHNISASNQVYRTTVTEYATNVSDTEPNLFVGCLDNRIRQYFYKKGIVTKTYMLDGLGRKHSEEVYTYKFYPPAIIATPTTTIADYNTTTTATIQAPTTATINASSFTDNTRVLPLLVATKSTVWEFDSETAGASSHWKEQYNSIDLYDKYGNVKQYQDKGASLSDISDDIKVNMLYFYNTNNVVNVPMEHRVTNNSVVFRLSRNFIDGIGRVNQIKKYLTTSLTTNFAQYDIAYDSFGNIKKITHPFGVNTSDSRMSYTYTYDPTTQTYPSNVVDAYGYSSNTKYRFDFGVPIMTMDSNQSVITYNYDSFGRPIAVKGPYQSSWTIKNEYFPNLATPVAVTSHFDATGEIYTSTFIDGLQRVIQTKKEMQNCSCINTTASGYRLSVSGKAVYDEFGRVTNSYLNNEELSCSGTIVAVLKQFAVFPDDPNQLTSTTYDYLDRPLTTTVSGLSAGTATTNMEYTFGEDRNGVTQFMKQITLPNGNVSQSYSDSKGRVTSSNQVGNQDTYWTSFEYDKINQLKNVKDANQAITYYTYDNFGRKLTTNHPDAGLATFKYDLASRLKESTNANLLAAGQKVLYKYNINQLTNVIFPSHTVTYTYGAVGALDKGVGRLIYQSDLTGEQTFKYGSLGEVTENRRKVVDPLGNPRTFVTNFDYDTWGRIRTLVYPDGEKVNYTYDNGGSLTHIENGDGQVYLNSICYDKFEQRSAVIYGNNTKTYYTYEPQQLLQQMKVYSSSGSNFMNNNYGYDLNSNVTQIDNGASGAALYHLGGTETKLFSYDEFNRLQHSEGIWHGELEVQQFTLDMEYNSLHNIVSKVQSHQWAPLGTNNFTDTTNSMINNYSYTGGNHPHAPSTIDVFDPSTGNQTEQINNTYDANGNLKQISHDDLNTLATTSARNMYWDEQNRLQAIAENGVAYHYVYDASGERVLKSSGSSANLVVNGEQVTALTNPGNYTMYPSGYLVVGTHDYTKHYYAGSQRIASRMGDLSTVENFQSFTSGQGTAGSSEALKQQAELENKKQFLQKQLTDIYAKAKLGKPNFTSTQATIDPAEAACQAEYNALFQYWLPLSEIDSTYKNCLSLLFTTYLQTQSYCQTMSIIKKISKCPINIEPKKLPIWWYHPDHLGSSSYLTDYSGAPSHYYNYLPFGEEMVSQNNSSYNNVYRFSGKELDQETGLSYFGARYYDPKYSFWLSVDPLAEKYPERSPYEYCFSNPLNVIDPTGMEGEKLTEPPVNGLEYFRDKTGEYFWNQGKNSYEHYADPNNNGGNSFQGYYSANEFKEPVGDYNIIFDLSNTKGKDVYDAKKTIGCIAVPTLMYLEMFGNVKDISDNDKYPGVKIYSSPDMNGALTAGNMIIMNSDMANDGETMDHEYGHYLDYKYHFNYNQDEYIDKIGIPSVKSAAGSGIHEKSVTEKRANRLGGAYSDNKALKDKYRPRK